MAPIRGTPRFRIYFFAMLRATLRGYGVGIDVVRWLHCHGARNDIKRVSIENISPLSSAFMGGQIEVLKWLILAGALCKEDDSGDLDMVLVRDQLSTNSYGARYLRRTGLEWTAEFLQNRNILITFLKGTMTKARNQSPLHILNGKDDVLRMIATYAGTVRGPEKLIRELATTIVILNSEFGHLDRDIDR
mmetsp:Transcript_25558/g.73903  ORF Transcript_25558/g.73903 Transcript_25558/m.73903 type:complete len:190 (+) Transcript_25558:316-885(+)